MTIDIEDNYIKEKDNWFCKTCHCEIYSTKKSYLSICSCLVRKEQSLIYKKYLSQLYNINNNIYECKKCGQPINACREKHYFSCIGQGTTRLPKSSLNPTLFSKFCDMGCGQESKFFHKTGKAYCCKLGAKCPIKVEKDREKKKGINPWEGKEHPKGMLGKSSYSKGLTKENSEGLAKLSLSVRKSYLLYGDQRKKKHHTQESKDKISKLMKNRYASGWESSPGRVKKYKHISPIAGEIYVDATWELSFAQLLDRVNIPWNRNKKRFNYINLKSKKATYQPDFFIPNWNKYIEVKGYKTDLDVCKWTQFNEPLLVVTKEHIKIIKSWLKNNEFVDEIKLFELIGQSTKEKYL